MATVFSDVFILVLFSVVSVALILLGYKAFDKLTSRYSFEDEVAKGNVSAAIVASSVILGMCYIIGCVLSEVLG